MVPSTETTEAVLIVDASTVRFLIHTDGSVTKPPSKGAPTDGGSAFILTDTSKQKVFRIEFRHDPLTTINRMELSAVIYGLRYAIKIENLSGVTIFTDSQYVKNVYDFDLLKSWAYFGWTTQAGTPVKNKDLWVKLGKIMKKFEARKVPVTFKKVKSHSGDVCNDYVDKLANKARREKKTGYAQINPLQYAND